MWIVFLLGFIVGISLLLILQALKLKRFDLSDQLLNLSQPNTLWGNLGYWQQGSTYPEAAQNLAEKVALEADLQATDNLLDVGFGSGQQLALWHDKFKVATVTGLNPSEEQSNYARQLLTQHGLDYTVINQAHDQTARYASSSFDKIVAVDCAYFFKERHQWFMDCANVMKPNSKLVLTDFVLHKEPNSLFHKYLLKLAFYLCGIPSENIAHKTNYINALQFAGLRCNTFEDISEPVIDGFCKWLPEYQHQLSGMKALPIWHKYSGTAKLLAWLRQRDLIGYYLISAERRQ